METPWAILPLFTPWLDNDANNAQFPSIDARVQNNVSNQLSFFYAECLVPEYNFKNSKIMLCLSLSIPKLAFNNGQTHHTIVWVNQPQTQTYNKFGRL